MEKKYVRQTKPQWHHINNDRARALIQAYNVGSDSLSRSRRARVAAGLRQLWMVQNGRRAHYSKKVVFLSAISAFRDMGSSSTRQKLTKILTGENDRIWPRPVEQFRVGTKRQEIGRFSSHGLIVADSYHISGILLFLRNNLGYVIDFKHM